MGELSISKAGDRIEEVTPEGPLPEPDLSRFLGDWINTHATTQCIERFNLAERDGAFYVTAVGKDSPIDWGEVRVTPYADSVGTGTAVAFHGVYEFGFMTTTLAANYNKGIIIAAYSTFTDGSPRKSYFTREFFYHDDGIDPS